MKQGVERGIPSVCGRTKRAVALLYHSEGLAINLERQSSITCGCIAQSVERWSNKPLVMGSSPIVTIFFFLPCSEMVVLRKQGRACQRSRNSNRTSSAFVAERLRRYVQVVVNFVGVGSSPTECIIFFLRRS